MFKLIKSSIKSAGTGVKNDPEVRKMVRRFPRFFGFLKKRLTPDEQFGLYLTIGIIVSSIFAYLFFNILEDFLSQDILVMADIRILNIVKSFRTPALNRDMLFLTYLGKFQIVLVGFLAVGFFLTYSKKWRYLITLTVSVIFGEIFPAAIKHLTDRTRPPLSSALIKEEGFSFPSGHAFIACSFYGMLAYFLYRKYKNRLTRIIIILVTLFLVLGIGFSRIYLGVHWPSDVFAGLASGAAWVTLLITVLEIRRKFNLPKRKKRLIPEDGTLSLLHINKIKSLGLGLFLVWLIFTFYFYKTHPIEQVAIKQKNTDQVIDLVPQDVPEELFVDLPKVSESLGGKPMEPINVIIVGGYDQIKEAFGKEGWLPCDRINAQSVQRLVSTTITNSPYPQAPGVPSLWDTKPNDFSFEKPTDTVREREHIHFWETPYQVNGEKVWLATAHFDQAVKMNSSLFFPTHSIDPAIDKERNKIKDDLMKTEDVENFYEYQIVEPTMGKNQVGDTFFTDGKAYIFYLKQI